MGIEGGYHYEGDYLCEEMVVIGTSAAAEYLGCSVSTVYRWVKEGKLRPAQKSITGRNSFDLCHLMGLREKCGFAGGEGPLTKARKGPEDLDRRIALQAERDREEQHRAEEEETARRAAEEWQRNQEQAEEKRQAEWLALSPEVRAAKEEERRREWEPLRVRGDIRRCLLADRGEPETPDELAAFNAEVEARVKAELEAQAREREAQDSPAVDEETAESAHNEEIPAVNVA